MTPGSAPSWRVQKPWLRTTTRSEPGTASSRVKVRPSIALAWSTVKSSGVARTAGTLRGSPRPAKDRSTWRYAARAATLFTSARQSSKVGMDTRSWLPSGLTSHSTTIRSGSG